MSLEQLLDHIFSSLNKGKTVPKHPFRYITLATESNGTPFQRMVVFRKINKNTITLYTDRRTPKVNHLKNNPNASLLFFDYKKMTQIQLQGLIKIDDSLDKSLWNNLSEKAKEDYTGIKTPGESINDFEEIVFDTDNNNFCKLNFHFTKIDYLQIGKPHHTRAKFTLENNKWKGNYVVP